MLSGTARMSLIAPRATDRTLLRRCRKESYESRTWGFGTIQHAYDRIVPGALLMVLAVAGRRSGEVDTVRVMLVETVVVSRW